MRNMGKLVRTGKFDLYLTRPISPFVYLVLQQFQYTFLRRLFFSIVFWLYSMKQLQIDWTLERVDCYCISLIAAFIIFSSITVITVAVSFGTIKSEEIVSYPVAILLGKDVTYSHGFYLSLVIAIVMGFTSYTLWHMGLKRYNSTGA